jgi:hypothetical protein
MTEYSEEEKRERERLISSIENIMKNLNEMLDEPKKPHLKVINGEG